MKIELDILLATYNGGKHIEGLLLSLKGQSFKKWRLLVHDDGSSDETVEIIKSYETIDKRIVLIKDGVKGLRASGNFLHLLKYTDAPYIMFCDQDDIWLEDKVKLMIKEIRKQKGPSAVYCNAYFYKNSKIIPKKVINKHPKHLKDALFLNGGMLGCTMVFNKKLLDLLWPLPLCICMHDHLITLAALSFGNLKYLDHPLLLYRQHEQNVTGNYKIGFVPRLKSFFDKAKVVIDVQHFKATKSFYDRYQKMMDTKNRSYFDAYFNFANSKLLIKRFFIVIRYGFKLGSFKNALLLKTILRKPINKN